MKKLDIADFVLLNEFYEKFDVISSDISLSNLLMWNDKYDFHYTIFDGFLYFINVKDQDTWYSSQPIGNYTYSFNESIKMQEKFFLDNGKNFVIKKADETFINLISDSDFKYSISNSRDEFDYLYNFEDLLNLSGNKFHKKKNHINKFISLYEKWHYENISLENIDLVRDFSDKWCDIHGCDNSLLQERRAINFALDNFDLLGLIGGVLYVDNSVVAFTIGERLNKSTLLIHFEKADINFQGSYNMINQQFLSNQVNDFVYINREQDLGLEGLRKSKLSYHPVSFSKKFTIRFK